MGMTEPAPITAASGEDRTMPAVAYALYLLGLATGGLTTLIGLVMAYGNRGAAGPVAAGHYTFLIRTFWLLIGWALIGGALFALGLPLSLVLVGLPLLAVGWAICSLLLVWFAVRVVLGVLYLARGEPYPRPRSWIV